MNKKLSEDAAVSIQRGKMVEDFALACKDMDSSAIYDYFENNLSEAARDAVCAYADLSSPEPLRSAFEEIGIQFNVQSLKDY